MHLVPSVPLVHCVIHLTSGEYLLCARHSGVCIVRHVHSAAEVKTWSETETESETEGAGGSIPEETILVAFQAPDSPLCGISE